VNDLKPFLERSLSSLPVSPWAVLLVIGLLIGVMMSFYTIPAESEGIVLRFGKYIEKVPSGLHAKLPFGIDTVNSVTTQR
jgi:membrane protease subunit HflK